MFPGGFEDPEYLSWERAYKVEASEFAKEILSPEKIRSLLKQKDYEEISNLAKKVVGKTTLIFPNEMMSFSDGLSASSENKKLLSESLYYHLYSGDPLKERFRAFVKVFKTTLLRRNGPLLHIFFSSYTRTAAHS